MSYDAESLKGAVIAYLMAICTGDGRDADRIAACRLLLECAGETPDAGDNTLTVVLEGGEFEWAQ